MSGNFSSVADMLTEWQDGVQGGTPPVTFPVADEGHPLRCLEIGPGLVTMCGAPPAAGKTALVMQLVFEAVRLSPDLKALVANVEMGPPALLDRQLARLAGLPLRRVRKRQLTAADSEPLAKGLQAVGALASRVAFLRPPFDLSNVARSADEFGADLILLDYVQRIAPPKEYADKRLSLNAVMDTVRAMADAGCAVLVVSAVGRQRDSQGKSSYDNLNLASFRESSELEYGADSAYLLIREPDSGGALLKCVKNRNDEPQDISLKFVGDYQRFDPGGEDGKLSAALRGVWGGEAEGGEW